MRALAAQRSSGADVVVPALGVLKRKTGPADAAEYVEVQVDPFPIREVIAGLGGGAPTFYLVFPDGTGLAAVDGQIAPSGDVLRAAGRDVTIALVFQDRVTRDPALWASQILASMTAVQGNTTLWQPFSDAVAAQTASGNRAPVLLLDETGDPLRAGSVDLVFGTGAGQSRRVALAPADLGDLQRTVAAAQPGRSRTLVGRDHIVQDPAGRRDRAGVPAGVD